jgi:hypothetical protein
MASLTRKITIRSLKSFAADYMPQTCVVRDLLLTDDDELEVMEFLVKMDVWLRLLKKV